MKQLLNAGRGHRAPRKAANSLCGEVGQNIADKKTGKRVRDRDPSGEGFVKKEKFPNSWKSSHRRVCGEFGISEGNITWRKEKKKKTHRISD